MATSKPKKDATEVAKAYPPGTRLKCTTNGKRYQIGTRAGAGSRFWTMCEDDSQRGQIEAHVILRHFEKVA